MSVNSLVLFKNVKITRDYSVVHDLTPSDWFDYLMNVNNVQSGDPSPPAEVWRNLVNYYRLPDVIRIEANFDDVREATYGCLTGVNEPGLQKSFGHLFFWVDSVRLVKQHTVSDTDAGKVLDTVELSVTPDIWSNKFTDCKLYDSFVVRRHEDRWWKDLSNVYHPRYFPNAGDDVGGAYSMEGSLENLQSTVTDGTYNYRPFFCIVNVVDSAGKIQIFICPGLRNADTGEIVQNINVVRASLSPSTHTICVDIQDILNGSIWAIAGVSASHAQSILVTSFVQGITFTWNSQYTRFEIDYDTLLTNELRSAKIAYGGIDHELIYVDDAADLSGGVFTSKTVTVTPKTPVLTNPVTETTYTDNHEPMLFRNPARRRKIVSGMGGTLLDMPDIDAFESGFTLQNIVEMASGAVAIYVGNDIIASNAKGSVGVSDLATLPIEESAWATYNAIQKTGDDIAYNAQQVSTMVGTATGAVGGLAGGAISGAMATGNPAGVVAGAGVGVAGGIVSGITRYWTNSENLRAKRETIKNSPCTVGSTGSGLTAVTKGYCDLVYLTLKLDDVSYNKLRTQYFYYGYNINMVVPGEISTYTRKYFDYIETAGAQIRGDVNAEEAQGIAGCFDRGVRIYHGYDGYKKIGTAMTFANTEKAFLE